MRIKNIELNNFRNYPEISVELTNDMVVLVGPNAVGKTNLLESVYFASVLKSFRDDTDNLFTFGKNVSVIRMGVETSSSGFSILEIFLEKKDKVYANFKINGVPKKRKDIQNLFSVVIFEPTDVDLLTNSPETRRKFMNMVLSQRYIDYLDALVNYKKALQFKNKLLFNIKQGKGDRSELDDWNKALVQYGSIIAFYRKDFMRYLNNEISTLYALITGFNKSFTVELKTLSGETLEEIKTLYENKLFQEKNTEIASGSSLYGPHRDDFSFVSNGMKLQHFSSRGERRGQILALKIAELGYLSESGNRPILLLDDVLSELDEVRRMFLLKFLQGRFQTFITTTHPLEILAQHITLTPSTD